MGCRQRVYTTLRGISMAPEEGGQAVRRGHTPPPWGLLDQAARGPCPCRPRADAGLLRGIGADALAVPDAFSRLVDERVGIVDAHALSVKYPAASESWAWFWVFPSPTLSNDPRADDVPRRHHLHEKRLQRDLKVAVRVAMPVARYHVMKAKPASRAQALLAA